MKNTGKRILSLLLTAYRDGVVAEDHQSALR